MITRAELRRGVRIGIAWCVLAAIAPFATAADLYFDVSSGSGLGSATNLGTYSWNTVLWNSSATGSTSPGRVNWSTNTARFNAGSNTYTVNVSAATLVSGITVTNGNITIGATGGGTLGLSASSTFDIASGKSLTIATGLSGASFGLTKTSTGTLNLTAANSYSGGTTVSGGTVNLSGSGTLGSTSASVLVNGGTLALGSTNQTAGAFTISSGSLSGSGTLTAATYALQGGTVSGKLGTGTATVTTGSTTLSGTLNAGTVNISSGTLSLSSANRIIDTAAVAVSGTGTLAVGGNDTVGTVSLNGGTISGAGTLTAATYALQGGTVSGKLGTGTATVTTGSTTLSGTLDAGTVNISSGTLSLSSANRIIDTAAVAVSGTGTLAVGGNDTVGTVSLNGGTISGAGTLTAATYALQGGTVSGKLGTGTATVTTGSTTLSGTLDAGTVNISSGTLTLGAADRLSNSAALNVAGGALAMAGNSDTVGAVTLSSGNITGTGTLTGTAFSASNTAAASISANLAGSATLTKSGAGTLTLSGANTYTGATTLNAGTLQISADSNLGTAPGTATWGQLTFGGGTLNTTASFTLNANRSILLNAGANNITAENGTTLTYGGLIQGSGNITFGNNGTGTGTVTLSGATSNTHSGSFGVNGGTVIAGMTGGATINNGGPGAIIVNVGDGSGSAGSAVLRLDGNQQLNSGSLVTINSDGKLALNNSTQSINQIAGTGLIDLATNGALSVGVNSGNSTFSGTISGAGTLTKLGAGGTLTLSGTNTYSGATAVTQGSLIAGATNTFSSASTVTLANTSGATLDLNNFSQSVGGLAGGGGSGGNVSLGTATLTTGANNTTTAYAGVVSGSGNLIKTGTGTLTLSGANSYTGTTTISQGTIAVATNAPSGANGALGNTTSAVVINDGSTGANATALTIATTGVTVGRAVTVANSGSGTVTLGGATGLTAATGSYTGNIALGRTTNLQADTGTNITFGTGVISGAGGINKTGTGTVTLTSANTFTGNVTVSDGRLTATNSANSSGGFYALGNHLGLVSDTTVVTVNSGATLAVSSSLTGATYSTNTQEYMTMSLNGSGYNGAGALTNLGGNSTWLGDITLAGNTTISSAAPTGTNNLMFLGPYIDYSPTTLNLNNNTLTFGGTGDIYIASTVGLNSGDTGNVILDGTGQIYFAGSRNYYTGTTSVNSGTLLLGLHNTLATPNVGILGNLTIGDGVGSANSAKVIDMLSDQISDSVSITVHSDGLLDLGTYSRAETVGALNLKGGRTASGSGMLYLSGAVNVDNRISDNTATTSTMDGTISFNSNNTVTVNGTNTLLVNAWIASGGFTKAGTGTMTLTHNNYNGGNGYLGITQVANGILAIRDSGALGLYYGGDASAGTVVNNGATLKLDNVGTSIAVVGERLTIDGAGYSSNGALNSATGTNSWAGPIFVAAGSTGATIKTDAGTLSLSGVITGTATTGNTQILTFDGSGNTTVTGVITDNRNPSSPYNDLHIGTLALTKNGSGTLTLSNAGGDTFTGAIAINAGTLTVNNNNVLASQTNTVAVASGATFSLTGGGSNSNTISQLTGAGLVSIAASTSLVVNNSVADTFDGRLTGSGLFEKQGHGTFTFSSTANTSAFNFAGTVQLTATATSDTLEFRGGSGTLNSSTNALSIGSLNLTGGTLLLTNAYINVGTLNITGDTILDFGTGARSILNATNIYIANGVVVTVKNWSSEVDFLFANSDFRVDNATGQLAIRNQIGTGAAYTPEDQVWFQGDPQSPDGSHTTWIDNTTNYYSYADREIRPVPEPSTYGALFLTGCLGLVAFKRFRKGKGR